ncbi:MAG: hypothetical protein AB7O96_13325 [Pseudobdellovibrionaceae bacterium]
MNFAKVLFLSVAALSLSLPLTVFSQTDDEKKEAQKLEDQKKLLETMLKSINDKQKEKDEEEQQASKSARLKTNVETVSLSATPRGIREMGNTYEIFFVELKEAYVLAPGDKIARNLRNLTLAQQKKKKAAFIAGKSNRNIYEVTEFTD